MKRFHFLFIYLFIAHFANANSNLPPFFTDNYAKIPAGTINFKGVNLDVSGFYMFKTELTNLQYQEFIHDVSKSESVDGLLPLASIIDNYYKLSEYQDYPIRGISKVFRAVLKIKRQLDLDLLLLFRSKKHLIPYQDKLNILISTR